MHVALHNMLCVKSREIYIPPGFTDDISPDREIIEGTWRNDDQLPSLRSQRAGNNVPMDAVLIREQFADYFGGPGQVDWQWKMLL